VGTEIKFVWDEVKRRSNLSKHGLDFARVAEVFSGTTFTMPDDRFAYGEARYFTLGRLNVTVVVVVHTEDNNTIRVISFRKATKHEQRLYFENTR
jgi:uncharacterized DUF497 family protein